MTKLVVKQKIMDDFTIFFLTTAVCKVCIKGVLAASCKKLYAVICQYCSRLK